MSSESVIIILKDKIYPARAGIPLHKALRMLDLPVNAHLALRDGQLITEDEMLKKGDRIELVAVISGG
jgi:sulfur carrier protein ThiS